MSISALCRLSQCVVASSEFSIVTTKLTTLPPLPPRAQDTEFPGVVARPVGSFERQSDYHYQTLRCNVDLLKIIQLGITFANDDGEFPDDCPTWQFNFQFNLQQDMYAQDSIDLLTRSGIEFRNHEERGINVEAFGEVLMSSGLVLNEDVKWISFHSGYDFGYLLKLLTNMALPGETDTCRAPPLLLLCVCSCVCCGASPAIGRHVFVLVLVKNITWFSALSPSLDVDCPHSTNGVSLWLFALPVIFPYARGRVCALLATDCKMSFSFSSTLYRAHEGTFTKHCHPRSAPPSYSFSIAILLLCHLYHSLDSLLLRRRTRLFRLAAPVLPGDLRR